MMAVRSGAASIAGGSNATGQVAGSETYNYATIQSGRAAYAKGEKATITGDGWAAGRPVSLTFVALKDPQHVTSPFHTSVTADGAGDIAYDGFSSDLMRGSRSR